jgi:peptide/nickel transport system ATP-binding protein
MSDLVLEVKNLSVGYLTKTGLLKAVEDVSFGVNEGDVIGIVGESGSGKSSLANGVLKLLKPPAISKGEVVYEGKNILDLSDQELREIRWKKMSYIPQGSMNSLNPVMRVKDQFLGIIRSHLGASSDGEILDRIRGSLEKVRLDSDTVLSAYPHELSGGMKQRVIIAMATCLKPRLILADEPTTALDVVTQKEIINMLKQLKKEMNLTLIMISHDVSILAEVCNHLLIMYAGRIVEAGPTKDILTSPKHPYTMGLVASIPKLVGEKKMLSIPGEPPNLINPPLGCVFHPRCKFRMDICEVKEPVLSLLESGRQVRCFLYGHGSESDA